MDRGIGKRIIDTLLAFLILFAMSGGVMIGLLAAVVWLGIYAYRHLH